MSSERVIFTCPHIITNIFTYLGPRDLSSCAQVCSLWNDLVKAEKKRRKEIFWFFKVSSSEDYDIKCLASDSCAVCDFEKMETSLRSEFCSIRIHPAFCMSFASSSFFENFETFFPSFGSPQSSKKRSKVGVEIVKRKYLNSVVNTALKPYLPVQCPVTFTVAPGIVGCNKDYSTVEVEGGPALTGFLFPHIPGVQVLHYAINGQNNNLSDFLLDKPPLKCLLMFVTPRGSKIVSKMLDSYLPEKDNRNIALGGCIIDRSESLLGSFVAFCGPNVEAASVVVKPRVKKDTLKQNLEVFKETGLLKNRCIAFMFVCVGRGYSLHQEFNLESSVFSSMFPQVPLIGVFGNGEIGLNYLPNVVTKSEARPLGSRFKRARLKQQYFYTYTTVFVLLSFKS